MTTIGPGSTIGILGGGQLGRMIAIAAAQLGYRTHIYAPEESGPAADVSRCWTRGAYEDAAALAAFADSVDVVTYEFENIDPSAVEVLSTHGLVRPGAQALRVAQDRLAEKNFVRGLGGLTAPFASVESLDDLHRAIAEIGSRAILKTNRIMQMGIEDIYGRFVGLVAQARRKSPQQIDAIAQGRVWDGGTARQIGLVDRFGGLEEAVAEAAKLAKLDPAKAKVYRIEKEPDKFAELIKSMSERDDEDVDAPRDMLSRQAMIQRRWAMQAVADMRGLISGAGVRADCLECRGYGAPRQVSAADERGLMGVIASLWR